LNNVNSYINEPDVEPSVVAMVQEHDQLKAVMLREKNGVFELIRTASKDLAETSWQSFAADFIGQIENESSVKLVIGYGAAGVVFYRINVPEVKEEELAALIRLQAEAKFPLPVEQMAFAWKIDRGDEKQLAVTIAAARKQQLQNFVADVSVLKPAKIILNYEGIVKTWKEFFAGGKKDGLVLDIGQHCTQVCLVEDAHLSNVASLDIGTNDFLAGRVETADRFNQDMKSVLEMFGFSYPAEISAYVLSDGRVVMDEIVSGLNSAGFNAKTMLPKVKKLQAAGEMCVSEIYEYRVAIGLAAMAFEPAAESINIFEGLYRPKGKTMSRLYSPKIAAVIAAAMFILLIIVCYLVDAASLKALEKRFSSSEKLANCRQLIERQKLIKEVALQRPDLLKLLSQINSKENNGVLLDGFHFKKGQPVTIRGQVKSDEQLYKFQESLLSKKGISKVRIQNTKKEKKGNKLNFSITFHYKNFTKKK